MQRQHKTILSSGLHELTNFRPASRVPKHCESARLLIRQYRPSDLEEFHTLYEASLRAHLAPWSPRSYEGLTPSQAKQLSRDHLNAALERWEDEIDYRFFIIRKEDNRIIGQVAVSGIVRNVSQMAHIGYWIGADYLNQGYATEATALAIYFAFEYLRLHRLTLWISPDNHPSLRVAEKLSLRLEGRAMRALYLGGHWQDTDIFAITSEEWPERREVFSARYSIL